MKLTPILEASFFLTAIVLAVLVVGLNCLQGGESLKSIGFLACDHSLTSADLLVKVGASAILALFLILLLGPVLAVVGRLGGRRRSRRSG